MSLLCSNEDEGAKKMKDLEDYIQSLYDNKLDKIELNEACCNLLRFFELLYKINLNVEKDLPNDKKEQ